MKQSQYCPGKYTLISTDIFNASPSKSLLVVYTQCFQLAFNFLQTKKHLVLLYKKQHNLMGTCQSDILITNSMIGMGFTKRIAY